LDNRARRKVMKTAIDAMPPFRRVTGPATRLRIKATPRSALNDAIGQQILTFNPAAHGVELDPVRKPKALVWTDARVAKWEQTGEKPSPVMGWTPEQTGAFLDFVAEDRLYAMWHLIAFRGLRRGEACAQPWSETNLDDHSLTVSAQLVQDGWEVETSEPKTDSGFRVVALDDDTFNVLKRHPRTAGRGPRGVGISLGQDRHALHPGRRLLAPSREADRPLRAPRRRLRAPADPAARPPARGGHAHARRRHRREDRVGHAREQRHPDHAGHLPERLAAGRQERGRGHRQAGPASAEDRGGGGP
jgi:integrase